MTRKSIFPTRKSTFPIKKIDFLNRKSVCLTRKLSFSTKKSSQKIQIDENVRVLKDIRPFLISEIVITMFGTISRVLTMQIVAVKNFLPRNLAIYYLVNFFSFFNPAFQILDIYILIRAGYVIKWIVKENRKAHKLFVGFQRFLCCLSQRIKAHGDKKLNEEKFRSETEMYFNMLEKHWN